MHKMDDHYMLDQDRTFLTANSAGPLLSMQVVKVHKRRVMAVAMTFTATIVLVLMAVVATVQKQDLHDWTFSYNNGHDDVPNDTMWRFGYEIQDSANETPGEEIVIRGRRPDAGDDDDELYGESESHDGILGEYDDGDDDQGDGVVSEYDNDRTDVDDDDDAENENENEVFQDGDFDLSTIQNSTDVIITTTTTTSTSTNVTTPLQNFEVQNIVLDGKLGDRKLHSATDEDPRVKRDASINLTRPIVRVKSAIENFVFWSRELEALAPKGLSDEQVEYFQNRSRQMRVTRLTPPTWDRCGRANNHFVQFEDGSHACARHRAPHDYLVQGEVLSFYLARLLGINNVPAVILSRVDSESHQWNSVHRQLSSNESNMLADTQWEQNTTVALIQWIDDLQRDLIPRLVLNALKTGRPISWQTKKLVDASTDQLTELLQWSDLIVFDYITGNYDRIASMQDAAEKEKQPDIFERDTIHNLAISRSSGAWRGLWLIDNESGLLDAYSLMYDDANTKNDQGSRFVIFHNRMLRTFCVFRRSTRHRLASLLRPTRKALYVLLEYVRQEEPLFVVPNVMTDNDDFADKFQQRVVDVYDWMKRCQKGT